MSRMMWFVLSLTAMLTMRSAAQAGQIELALVGIGDSSALTFQDNGSTWNLGMSASNLVPLYEFAPNNIGVVTGVTTIEFHGIGPLDIPPGEVPLLQLLPAMLTFTTSEGSFEFVGVSLIANRLDEAVPPTTTDKGWVSLGVLSGSNQTSTPAAFMILFDLEGNPDSFAWLLFTAPALIPEPSTLLLTLGGAGWFLIRLRRTAIIGKSAASGE